MKLAQLHLHSSYTLLESSVRIEEAVKKAKEYGYEAIGIADKNNLFGAVKFFTCAKNVGIKPVIGCELSLSLPYAPLSDRSSIVLYAKNEIGYKNLSKLVSQAYRNNEDYPFISIDQISENRDGLIGVIGLKNSLIYKHILYNASRDAVNLLRLYLSIFSYENLYIAISSGLNKEEDNIMAKKIAFAKSTGIQPIAFNEIYYTNKEDAPYQDVLYCIKNGDLLSNQNRKRLPSNNYYMHSMDEMMEEFKACPEALENTVKLSNACNYEFEFGKYHMPAFDLPSFKSSKDILKELAYRGLKTRYEIELPIYFLDSIDGDFLHSESFKELSSKEQEIIERMNYELSLILDKGFEDYFLITQDFVNYAKSRGILVGPARGSGGGSLLCYLLGITEVDPIKYSLLFERFLNPERIDMPDLDIDFQDDRKSEVLDYVIEKYGSARVAQIITFGTLSERAVLKDVARVLGYHQDKINYNDKKLLEYSSKIEGLPRHTSIHAAGVVISKGDMNDLVPTIVKNQVCTQYDMDDIKELGLVKMDFLSLKKLTIVSDILSIVKNDKRFDMDTYEKTHDDIKTYQLLSSGENTGVFQLESKDMMRFFTQLRPKNLEDIIIGISIFRPGPAKDIPTLLHNRIYPRDIKYDHPLLESILKETYGCLIYQEQVMEIVRVLAGFSYARADKIRRAMSKKDMKTMGEEKRNFIYGNPELGIDGAIARGVSKETALKIFDKIADFAKYAFNKSHATGYAIIAYQMAYLKANYPKEFMLALLNSEIKSSDKGKLHKYLRECKSMRIPILLPSVKYSKSKFTIEKSAIRYALSALKYLGSNTVHEIEKLQNSGDFPKSLEDFISRMPSESLNHKSVEALTFSSALNLFHINKASIINNFDAMHRMLSTPSRKSDGVQISLFDLVEMDNKSEAYDYALIPEFDSEHLIKKMDEMTGFKSSFFELKPIEKKLYIKIFFLGKDEKFYIESLPKSKNGYQLIVYEEKFDRLRQFKEKVELTYDILTKLKTKFGDSNVKVEKN